MKTKFSAILFATLLSVGAVYANSTTTSVSTTSEVSTQQGTQTVTAIYVDQGGLDTILIRISNGYVVAYCSGRDYQGRQIWDDIEPVKIYPNNGGARTSDATINRETQMKKNRAQLGQTTIYF